MAPTSAPMFQNVVTYKPDYDKIFKSSMVNFLVGNEKHPMAIHAGAIESLSVPLSAMVNDLSMKNPTDRAIVLEDTTVETFHAFTEFAYTGDYSRVTYDDNTATQTKRKADEAHLSQEKTPCKERQNTLAFENSNDSEQIVTRRGQSRFLMSPNPIIATYGSTNPSYLFDHSTDSVKTITSMRDRFRSLNYSRKSSKTALHVLVAIDLYVFAKEFSIKALRQRALSSIHSRLCFRLNRVSPIGVVDSIAYIYSKSLVDGRGDKGSLRDSCLRYAVSQAVFLHKNAAFKQLLGSDPAFAIDFVRALTENMCGSENNY